MSRIPTTKRTKLSFHRRYIRIPYLLAHTFLIYAGSYAQTNNSTVQPKSNVNHPTLALNATRRIICPNPWVYHADGNNCVLYLNVKDTYENHKKACRLLRPNESFVGIVIMPTMAIAKHVCNYAKQQRGSIRSNHIIVSATDNYKEGLFLWDTTGKHLIYNNWDRSEPNNQGFVGGVGNCVVQSLSSCKFIDVNCTNDKAYTVCTIPNPDACERMNGECHQVCLSTGPQHRDCLCEPGYIENVDGKSCDIQDLCSVQNGRCDHICERDSGQFGRNCTCRKGFIQTTDARCDDINECQFLNGKCQHICNNKHGSRLCSCVEGFHADDYITEECIFDPYYRDNVLEYVTELLSPLLALISVATTLLCSFLHYIREVEEDGGLSGTSISSETETRRTPSSNSPAVSSETCDTATSKSSKI